MKVAFRQVVDMMVDVFSANLPPDAEPQRDRALALVARGAAVD
jgi:hypothetical protein